MTEGVHPRARRLDLLPASCLVQLILAEEVRAVRAAAVRAQRWARWVEAIAHRLSRGGRWILVGAGTSGRLCAMQAAEVGPTFGVRAGRVVAVVAGGPRALRRAVEGAEDNRAGGAAAIRRLRVGRADAVLGISASGRTPFVLGALAEARRRGAWCARLTARMLGSGPEIVAGSTRMKAGTATKAVLDAISTSVFVRLGGALGPWMVGVRPVSAKLARRARRIVQRVAGVSAAQAGRLLRQAGGDVRVAIVMGARRMEASEARRQLRAAGGIVRRALAAVGRAGAPGADRWNATRSG